MAAHRLLRRWTRAGLCLCQRQRGPAVAHGHDRCRRRWRARLRRGYCDPVGTAVSGRSGRVPERALTVGPATDAVPRAAFQPARRQHLNRARRGGLVTNLHGRRGIWRRCRACCLRPYRCGSRRSVPGRRFVQCSATGHPAALRDGRFAVEAADSRRLGASGGRWRHGAGVGGLLPGGREFASTPPSAVRLRWLTSPRSPPIAAGVAQARRPRPPNGSLQRCAIICGHHMPR